MYLFIDAGNTRVKWALLAANELIRIQPALSSATLAFPLRWSRQGSSAHHQIAMIVEELRDHSIEAIHISNVAGELMQQQLQTTLQALAPQIKIQRFVSQPFCAGVHNAYANPAQLGSDRFASAIAAHALFPQRPVLVATCGTATTIDAINAEGVFIGGMILPGLQLMVQSLAQNTAQLPQVDDPRTIQNMFADHTRQAIINGCIQAQIGAIERAYAEFSKEENTTPACIISGGAASYLLPHLSLSNNHQHAHQHTHMDALVLTGLAIAAATVQQK
jgi:type III pantothenate kinase